MSGYYQESQYKEEYKHGEYEKKEHSIYTVSTHSMQPSMNSAPSIGIHPLRFASQKLQGNRIENKM